MKEPPAWKNTLNAQIHPGAFVYGCLNDAIVDAKRIGYPYVAWNGLVYDIQENKVVAKTEELDQVLTNA